MHISPAAQTAHDSLAVVVDSLRVGARIVVGDSIHVWSRPGPPARFDWLPPIIGLASSIVVGVVLALVGQAIKDRAEQRAAADKLHDQLVRLSFTSLTTLVHLSRRAPRENSAKYVAGLRVLLDLYGQLADATRLLQPIKWIAMAQTFGRLKMYCDRFEDLVRHDADVDAGDPRWKDMQKAATVLLEEFRGRLRLLATDRPSVLFDPTDEMPPTDGPAEL